MEDSSLDPYIETDMVRLCPFLEFQEVVSEHHLECGLTSPLLTGRSLPLSVSLGLTSSQLSAEHATIRSEEIISGRYKHYPVSRLSYNFVRDTSTFLRTKKTLEQTLLVDTAFQCFNRKLLVLRR